MKKWKHQSGAEAATAPGATPDGGDGADPLEADAAEAVSAEPPPPAPPVVDGAAAMPEPECVPVERLQRLQADFDNYRKRMIRDRAELVNRATEDLMLELLPVLDNFDIALRHAAESPAQAALAEGFRLVAEQLESVLRKFGLQPVDAERVVFDPHRHEAVAHVPHPEQPDGMITEQTRRGFCLGEKLLRAAQVVVSSGPPATFADTPRED